MRWKVGHGVTAMGVGIIQLTMDVPPKDVPDGTIDLLLDVDSAQRLGMALMEGGWNAMLEQQVFGLFGEEGHQKLRQAAAAKRARGRLVLPGNRPA